ncbi:MAG: hypothetical protein RJA44_1949 [Pseudomonadota bacterium]
MASIEHPGARSALTQEESAMIPHHHLLAYVAILTVALCSAVLQTSSGPDWAEADLGATLALLSGQFGSP